MCSCVPFALRQSRTRSCRNGGTTDTSTRALVDFASLTGNRVLMPGDHQIIFGTAALGSREICCGTMSRSSEPTWSDAACCACVVCRVVGYRVDNAHGHAGRSCTGRMCKLTPTIGHKTTDLAGSC